MKGVCRFSRVAAAKEVEKDYVGLSEKDSSGGGAEEEEEVEKKGKEEEDEAEEEEEEEEELELGLTLGAKKKPPAARAWGQGCRILTAKDFPSLVARTSSPSSVSSSSAGTKRAADSVSPDAVGSAHQPSQVVVGWPPIRAFRMNSLFNLSKDPTSEANTHKKATQSSKNSNTREENESKDPDKKGKAIGRSLYVKVNMDGDPIGRKVDLNAHHSYETLALALELMFHKPTMTLTSSIHRVRASKLLDGSSEFALTYEDKDGDWMLVGDVPWGMFLETVKRLRIMRTSDANGLAPRLQSPNRPAGLIGSKR